MDPVEYVLTENLYRRHLTQGQKGMVAVRALDYHMAEAKERQRAAGKEHGRGQENVVAPAPQAALPGVEVLVEKVHAPVHEAIEPAFERQAVAQAGKAVGVSGRSVAAAKFIMDHGTEEEIKAVETGKAGLKPVEQQVRARVRQQPDNVTRHDLPDLGADNDRENATLKAFQGQPRGKVVLPRKAQESGAYGVSGRAK